MVQEYLDLNHARPVTAAELLLPPGEVYYLPMHGVHKASSTTTKLRVVFDASSKTSNGLSLNDNLAIGPMLHPPLDKILLRFRLYRISLTGDISKMYREILLASPDQQLHRFLWRASPDQAVQEWCMNRVTFGVAPSPFLAVQTLQQAGKDFGQDWQYHLNTSFYVDDLLAGADSEEEALALYSQLTSILTKAGFTLRKFRSSSAQVLSKIPVDLKETLPQKELVDNHSASYPKALGISWDSVLDTDVSHQVKFIPSKRGILADVSRTFDVLGWITPVILPMKILLQELWRLKKDWDDPVPEALKLCHQTWREELPQLASVSLPRCYFSAEATVSTQLHGFCDASEKAFAATIYLRATYQNSPPTVRLVVAVGLGLTAQLCCAGSTRAQPGTKLLWQTVLPQLLAASLPPSGTMCQQRTTRQTVPPGASLPGSSGITHYGGMDLLGYPWILL